MFELKTHYRYDSPPFNILILWGLSLILAKFNSQKIKSNFNRTWFLTTLSFKYPFTLHKQLKDSLITEDHLTLQDYQQAQAIVLLWWWFA